MHTFLIVLHLFYCLFTSLSLFHVTLLKCVDASDFYYSVFSVQDMEGGLCLT